jgi:hypothetical protein
LDKTKDICFVGKLQGDALGDATGLISLNPNARDLDTQPAAKAAVVKMLDEHNKGVAEKAPEFRLLMSSIKTLSATPHLGYVSALICRVSDQNDCRSRGYFSARDVDPSQVIATVFNDLLNSKPTLTHCQMANGSSGD